MIEGTQGRGPGFARARAQRRAGVFAAVEALLRGAPSRPRPRATHRLPAAPRRRPVPLRRRLLRA